MDTLSKGAAEKPFALEPVEGPRRFDRLTTNGFLMVARLFGCTSRRRQAVRYKAVIFDLFGTLVDNWALADTRSEYEQYLAAMAEVVAAPCEAFSMAWGEAYASRMVGDPPTLEGAIESVAATLRVYPRREQLQRAAQLRLAYTRRELRPRPDALETIGRLRDVGCKTGLISNCGPDVLSLWLEMPFAPLLDASVLSCQVRMAKPDRRIYELACARLGVEAERCLYVGDGEGGELAGAASLGLQPVLIRASYQDPPGFRRPHVEPWGGLEVGWLSEVLSLIKEEEK